MRLHILHDVHLTKEPSLTPPNGTNANGNPGALLTPSLINLDLPTPFSP